MRARGTQAKFQVRPEHVALETHRGIIGNLFTFMWSNAIPVYFVNCSLKMGILG